MNSRIDRDLYIYTYMNIYIYMWIFKYIWIENSGRWSAQEGRKAETVPDSSLIHTFYSMSMDLFCIAFCLRRKHDWYTWLTLSTKILRFFLLLLFVISVLNHHPKRIFTPFFEDFSSGLCIVTKSYGSVHFFFLSECAWNHLKRKKQEKYWNSSPKTKTKTKKAPDTQRDRERERDRDRYKNQNHELD